VLFGVSCSHALWELAMGEEVIREYQSRFGILGLGKPATPARCTALVILMTESSGGMARSSA